MKLHTFSLLSTLLILFSNPLFAVDYSKHSVAEGAKLFKMNCVSCHGSDGTAKVNFMSDATNLTTPKQWRNGTSLEDIFTSINKGRAADMPAFEWIVDGEEEIWHLVNYVISLWPEAQRQELLKQ